ncbi:MAG: ABC transporter permease, partial [Phenylobacterium sp.]|uniref:ABC transporter permease n=1 Tax=Phenylobacterium sp. TaxID=1871053 RepID=UPI0027354777
ERRFGTLTFLLLSPASRIAVFVGRLLPGVAIASGVSVFTSILGFLVVGWPLNLVESFGYLLLIFVASLAGAALGLVLSAFGLIYRDIYQISSAAQLVLLVITGATVASSDLPQWVRTLAQGSPLTHAIQAARELVSDALSVSDYWVLIASETLVAIFWLLVALLLMKSLEIRARQKATVELY